MVHSTYFASIFIPMPEVRIPLKPSNYYHIYNHAVGDDKFFIKDSDYVFFIFKMREYILPVTDIIAYCLQPNHFHIVVQIKSRPQIIEYLQFKLGDSRFTRLASRDEFVESQLSRIYANLFSSYAKRYNLLYDRLGTLFKRSFMRKSIESTEYLHKVISYVHHNPVRHDYALRPEEWKYSSYNTIVNKMPSFVDREGVLEIFGGMNNFLDYHLSGHPT
jgi:putative transposase